MGKAKIAAAWLIVGLLIGFVPVYWQSREAERRLQQSTENLESQLARSNEQLRMSLLQGELGTLLIDVQRQNFGEAGSRSSAFFNALSQTAETTQNNQTKDKLAAIDKYRDSITSGIAKADPETAKTLQQLYLDLGSAVVAE
jgi:predicted histidine transporter YuiF (NhaC family)